MLFSNFRSADAFDPQDDDYQNAGGLPGLLRDAMLRQGLQQGRQLDSVASSAPNSYSDSYSNPQGLFGRLLALQRSQGLQITADQTNASSSAPPMVTPVQYRIPIPVPLPFPPTGPQPVPQIPMPHLPEPWPTIGKIMQLLPGLARGSIGKDDENCPNCQAEEDASIDGARKTPSGPGSPKSSLPIPPFSPKSNKFPGSSGGYGGGGGRRNRGDDDDSQCYERESQEIANCYKRKEEYPHLDFLPACVERAKIRRDLCVRSGGSLNHEGPGEWSPNEGHDDEEIWINIGR